MRVAFITNFCPHYRVRTFELLAQRIGARMLFFSRGGERYWPSQLGVRRGEFPHVYLSGVSLGNIRITPGLPWRILTGRWDAVVKCINGRFALPASYLAARLTHTPFILWTGIWHRLKTPTHRLLHPWTRWIYRHADAVVVYGTHVERYLVSEGVNASRIFVAPHAVDNESYRRTVDDHEVIRLRQDLDIPSSSPIILYIGRLVPEKGLPVLVHAFASLRNRHAHLLVVGSGGEGTRMEREAEHLQVRDRMRFVPAVRPEEVVPYYAAADLLVLPSITTAHFREPWGLVVNEALNQGTPVVASDAVGAAAGGLVVDGETGRVVPEADERALARALDDLLANPQERRRLGQSGRDRVLGWSQEAMAEGFRRAVYHAQGHEETV